MVSCAAMLLTPPIANNSPNKTTVSFFMDADLLGRNLDLLWKRKARTTLEN